jgi:F0F1-type ATP synthase delta subunit
MKDTYTAALLELLDQSDSPESVLKGFKNTLKERGHTSLYVPVLSKVLRILSSQKPRTVVTVKSDADYTAQKTAIAATLAELGATADPVVAVDNTIVGGYIVEHNNARQDNSYKTKLLTLYRQITRST